MSKPRSFLLGLLTGVVLIPAAMLLCFPAARARDPWPSATREAKRLCRYPSELVEAQEIIFACEGHGRVRRTQP